MSAGLNTSAESRPSPPHAEFAVSCRELSRSFGSTRALDGVDLDIRAGSFHALVGQNGAGKSTCLGMIAGRISPSSGEVAVLGQTFQYGNPRAARDAGVAAVYQELMVLPHLSPQANVFLSEPVTKWGLLQQRAMRKRYTDVCAELGIPASPNVQTQHLSVAQQQLIEIVRAVVSNARVLLLDEPTAALAIGERDALFRVLASLKAQGTTIILVSHNLDEVLANSDAVTVFRDGHLIETRDVARWSKRDLIESMLGNTSRELLEAELEGATAGVPATTVGTSSDRPAGEVMLRVRGLSLPGRLRDIDLEIKAGEVLGIAGLMGAGRSSLLRAIAGAEPGVQGTMEVNGQTVSWPSSPRASIALGIGFVAEDRKTEGVCLGMTCAENVALSDFGSLSRFGYLSPRRMATRALPLLTAAGVSTEKLRHEARTLSGGNQQKLLFARVSYQEPKILLADEPTRGVDVGAKAEILREVRRLAHEDGVAVALISSELEEVLAFSDRILVIAEGRITKTFDNTTEVVTTEAILEHAFATSEVAA